MAEEERRMSSTWCPNCQAYIWPSGSHQCPPLWTVILPEYDPDYEMKIYAVDAEAAAEKAVEQNEAESAEYYCLDGSEVPVIVRGGDGVEKRFIVTGEMVAEYYAKEVEQIEE